MGSEQRMKFLMRLLWLFCSIPSLIFLPLMSVNLQRNPHAWDHEVFNNLPSQVVLLNMWIKQLTHLIK